MKALKISHELEHTNGQHPYAHDSHEYEEKSDRHTLTPVMKVLIYDEILV